MASWHRMQPMEKAWNAREIEFVLRCSQNRTTSLLSISKKQHQATRGRSAATFSTFGGTTGVAQPTGQGQHPTATRGQPQHPQTNSCPQKSRRPHPQSNASGFTQLAAAENSATWSRQLRQLLISSYHGRNNSSAEMLHRFDGWNSCGSLAWPSFNLLALSAFSFRSPAMCATSRSHSLIHSPNKHRQVFGALLPKDKQYTSL